MRLFSFFFTVLAIPYTTGSALAQDTVPSTEGEVAPTETAPPTTPALPEVPAAPAPRWPREIINRVLTYPKGVAVAGLDISTSTSHFFDPATLRVLGGYGISDDLEINFAHYAFATNAAGKGSVDAGLGYKILRGAVDGKLEMIARVQTGYSLAAKGLNPLAVGTHVQYNVTPKIALITPGGQLSVALAGDVKPITFGLPVSLGFQATPELYLQLDTTLATFSISNSATTFIFADSTPLFAGAYYNVLPALDVNAGFSVNATPATGGVGDTLAVLVGARYYIGQL